MSIIFSERELLDRIAHGGASTDAGINGMIQKTAAWTGAVTGTALWTPATGNKWVISMITINVTTKCTVTVFDGFDDADHEVFKGEILLNDTVVIPYQIPRPAQEINDALKYTTSGTGGFITVYGWEIGNATQSTTSTSTSSSSSSTSSSSISTSSSSTSISTSSSSSSSTSSSSYSSSSSSSSTSISTSSSSSSSTSSSSISTSSSSSSSSSVSQTYS